MFAIGSTVKNKFNSKMATVVDVLDTGLVVVRFDGDTGTVALHPSRFEAYFPTNIEKPFSSVDPETFKKGDYIQVSNGEVTVKGAALSEVNTFGYSTFDMLTDDGQFLGFNANYVNIDVLFRADIARGQMPNY